VRKAGLLALCHLLDLLPDFPSVCEAWVSARRKTSWPAPTSPPCPALDQHAAA
jgi:hypothetical protein